MGDRLGTEAVLLVPAAGTQVQVRDQRQGCLPQTLAQGLSKQLVIAIPNPFVIEGDQEQVGMLQQVEQGLTPALGPHSIAQGSAQAIQERGLHQEVLDGCTLMAEDFVQQVVRYVVMAATEGSDEAGRIVTALEGEGRELQAGSSSPITSVRNVVVSSCVKRRSLAR